MTALALRDDQTQWDQQQIAVLEAGGIDGDVSDAELAAFLHECQRRKLDPFTRQIYLIGRYDSRKGRKVYRSQTSIDGFRLIARRSADKSGIDYSYEDTIWFDEQGQRHEIWLSDKPPAGAKVVVIRNGQRFDAVARFGAYVQVDRNGNPTGQWRNMADVMVAKCLPSKAIIQTDRGPLPIGRIVNERMPVRVRSIDLATGVEVWAPVVNWWRNGSTDQWVRIWAPNGTRGNRCIRITADHPIWTPTGWRKAGELSVGDQIAVTSPTLSSQQVQVILGGLLGDGHLGGRRTGNSLPHYSEAHAMQQAGYLKWKAAALANLTPSLDEADRTDGAGGTHKVLRMRTAAVPALRQFRTMDPTGRLNALSDLGVAVWLMDDGSIKSTGHGSQNPYIRIYCCGFGTKFAEAAAAFLLDRYGVTAKVCRPEKNPYLRIGSADTARLLPWLAPWIRYDAAADDKVWVGGQIEQGDLAGMAFVPVSRMEIRTGGEPEGRYDIEVSGTHTFVYNNIVVSNCAEALALRKAFPEDLGGIYTEEEMAQVDNPQRVTATAEVIREGRDIPPDETWQVHPAPETEAAEEWIAAALRIIPDIGLDACRKLWREAREKVRDGEVTEAGSARVLAPLKERMEALANPPQDTAPSEPASPVAAGLDADDPWTLKIEDLGSDEEAAAALDEATELLVASEITADRFGAIEDAITARFPGAGREAEAA